MNIYTLDLSNYNNISLSIAANVLTIGNFDGVHRGHQAMLTQLKQSAATMSELNDASHKISDKSSNQFHDPLLNPSDGNLPVKLQTMVMIFEPQPREYFAKHHGDNITIEAPARLTSLQEKIALLNGFNIDNVIVAHFDEPFRSLSAQQFADLLVNKLNVKALVLGDDFKFGHDRTGDSHFLREYGLPVTNLHTITDTEADTDTDTKTDAQTKNVKQDAKNITQAIDTRISSTRIRECLALGDIATANYLLGHDYAMIGEVIHGDKIGRTIDFPTANIALNRVKPPLHGIFGVDVVILDDNGEVVIDGFDKVILNDASKGIIGLRPHSLFGTANIGTRPTVDNTNNWRLEVHFPKFSGDLYGKTLNVRFLHYLHGEKKYDSLEDLKAGIEQDVTELVAWREDQ